MPSNKRPLRPGDMVEVRSAAEILATLDSDAAVDRMPFMPEMARYAGRRVTVTRRVDKICDTIARTGSRRMDATMDTLRDRQVLEEMVERGEMPWRLKPNGSACVKS
jgi:hypothetical protein